MTDSTHAVTNQFDELVDYNLFATDLALRDALARAGADWAVPQLDAYGARLGSADTAQLADEANQHTPELHAFDRRGRRIDRVDFHPAWHTLLGQYRHEGFVSLAFRESRRGRGAAPAAGVYRHGQIAAGPLCPGPRTPAARPGGAEAP
ncbi:DNA alkylation response protein, partial [Burkholderia cenocepacia]|nr:DNA alkylation response protein [Burkholderia cenocepacia]